MTWTSFQRLLDRFSDADQRRIHKAFELGDKLHQGQKRKSGEPYFMHPVAVAQMLLNVGADPDTIIAALLHDTVEDTPITLEEIDEQFNGDVRKLVEGVTKLSSAEVAAKPGLDEQIETLRKMFSLMEDDVRIMVIKLFDRLHNMQTLQYLSLERQQAMAKETMDVFVKIADRLSMQQLSYDLEGMCLAVLDPVLHKQLDDQHKKNVRLSKNIIPTMQKVLEVSSAPLAKKTDLTMEDQSWEKLKMQLEAAGSVVTGLSMLTIVFVCPNREDCYQILGVLHGLWPRETNSFQDFINAPMINGYRGLHTTVILEDGTRIRCKIRTQEMHQYAIRGVTTLCFSGKKTAFDTLLPWTKRIASLTQDSKDRSAEFWQSLQNDILGESITVHGPGDQIVQLPKGSTALDGAFFVFQDSALSLNAIKIDGQDARFSTPITHAVSIDATFSRKWTVQREWLQWVQSGYAKAKIRGALASQSTKDKLAIGRQMLQETMLERRQGFLEEFSASSLEKNLPATGYDSLSDIFIAIADGHVEPREISESLFAKQSPAPESDRSFALTFSHQASQNNVEEITRLFQKYAKQTRSITVKTDPKTQDQKYAARLVLTPQEQTTMAADLSSAGLNNATLTPSKARIKYVITIAALIVLWGLDPTMASLVLDHYDVSSIDLTIIRFWSLTLLSGIFLLRSNLQNPFSQSRISIKNSSLWISVLLLIGVSLSTYVSLRDTAPSHYTIPMTAAGILLTSIVNRKHWKILLLTWTLLILGTFLLGAYTPNWPVWSIVSTLVAVGCFTAFSVVSERYKRQEHVDARAAQYFFVLSLLGAVLTLPLLPFSDFASHDWSDIGAMAIFAVLFTGFPYYIYYYLLSHREIDFVLRYSFLIIPVTILSQVLLLRQMSLVTIIAGILVSIGALLPLFAKSEVKQL